MGALDGDGRGALGGRMIGTRVQMDLRGRDQAAELISTELCTGAPFLAIRYMTVKKRPLPQKDNAARNSVRPGLNMRLE